VAAEGKQTILEQLDPPTRAKVLAALVGLMILAVGAIVLIWLGGRMARRYAGLPSRARRRPIDDGSREDDWWKKPLVSDGADQETDGE